MTKMLLGLVAMAALTAQAQTSSTSVPTTAAPAAQTSSTSATAAAPKAANPWGAGFYFNIYTMGNEFSGSDTSVTSVNYLELSYKLTENIKLAARHNYGWQMANGSDELSERYTFYDPELQLKTKLAPIAGSSPVAIGLRYYVPVSEPSRNSNRIGTIRLDTSAEWNLTPKFALGAYLSPRWTINTAQNPSAAVGNDDVLRIVASPSGTYSFNDNVNVYYAPALDYASTSYVRGNWGPRRAAYGLATASNADNMVAWNVLSHEVGANFQVGPVGINPAVINYVDLNDGTGHGQPERMEYDLNLLATF